MVHEIILPKRTLNAKFFSLMFFLMSTFSDATTRIFSQIGLSEWNLSHNGGFCQDDATHAIVEPKEQSVWKRELQCGSTRLG